MMVHPNWISIAVVAGAVVLSVGCGGSADGTSTGSTTGSSTEAAVTTPTETETVVSGTAPVETTPTRPEAVVVRFVVKDGRSEGGIRRVRVKQGERVRLIVSADAADEVHLHGYDITSDVAPGRQGRIAFVAKVPGRFEVELEEPGTQIGELEVRP